jgi:hypothetical protein
VAGAAAGEGFWMKIVEALVMNEEESISFVDLERQFRFESGTMGDEAEVVGHEKISLDEAEAVAAEIAIAERVERENLG